MDLRTALKKIRPIHGLIVSLLLLLILVPMNVYWNIDRINKFQAWRTEYQDAQEFTFYDMQQAAYLVNITSFPTNSTVQAWYREALSSAFFTVNQISTIDTAHGTQFFQMDEVFDALGVNITYVAGLTNSQRSTLSGILQSIGNDILNAYTKYGDFVSPGPWSLTWYSGPSPPDDNLVNEAYILATTLPGLPTLSHP